MSECRGGAGEDEGVSADVGVGRVHWAEGFVFCKSLCEEYCNWNPGFPIAQLSGTWKLEVKAKTLIICLGSSSLFRLDQDNLSSRSIITYAGKSFMRYSFLPPFPPSSN